MDTIASERLVEAMERLDETLCALAPDAPEQERATLAAESLETLVPVIACFDAANWLRPATDRERFLDEIAFAGYNEAQQDVYDRIERGIEEIMTERAQRRMRLAPLHKSSTSRLTPTQRHSFYWPLEPLTRRSRKAPP